MPWLCHCYAKGPLAALALWLVKPIMKLSCESPDRKPPLQNTSPRLAHNDVGNFQGCELILNDAEARLLADGCCLVLTTFLRPDARQRSFCCWTRRDTTSDHVIVSKLSSAAMPSRSWLQKVQHATHGNATPSFNRIHPGSLIIGTDGLCIANVLVHCRDLCKAAATASADSLVMQDGIH